MIRRSLLALSVMACFGVLAAGCGSSSSSKTTPASAATSAGTSTPAAAATSGAGSSTSPATAANNPAVAQAVAACKSSINSQPTLSASLKAKLTAICDKAGSGDVNGAKKAYAQVCQEVVKATVPSQAQAQALAACPKA